VFRVRYEYLMHTIVSCLKIIESHGVSGEQYLRQRRRNRVRKASSALLMLPTLPIVVRVLIALSI